MAFASGSGVHLYYEESGRGEALVWCHELAGSHESWALQRAHFQDRYRVITYNARGYPPSEVPETVEDYSQDLAVEDLRALLDDLGIAEAHIAGLSMGGATALHFGLRHPERTRSLIVAGAGTGSTDAEAFARQCETLAASIEREGMAALHDYARGPTRFRLGQKDPAAFAEFTRLLMDHSPAGMARTVRGVQGGRPPLSAYAEELAALELPTLIVVGDEDEPCLDPALFLKRQLRRSGIVMLPQTGHALNLEEPERFNRAVDEFLSAVERGAWPPREEGSGAGFLAPRGPV